MLYDRGIIDDISVLVLFPILCLMILCYQMQSKEGDAFHCDAQFIIVICMHFNIGHNGSCSAYHSLNV